MLTAVVIGFAAAGGGRAAPSAAPHVARFYTGDEAGFERRHFYTVEPAVYFYATLTGHGGASALRDEREPRFEVVVRDRLGREVARLGGPLPALPAPADSDLPRDCANRPENGLRIADGPLAERPGRYLALIFLDGAVAAERWFTIGRLQGEGRLTITSAAVEDERGTRRFTFTAGDRGVYAHVTLVNASRDRPHEHLVEVIFEGPRGRVCRALGGRLKVPKGARLDGRDLPSLHDPQHHDGLRIRGTPIAAQVGAWKMIVSLDGRVVREVPFRIIR